MTKTPRASSRAASSISAASLRVVAPRPEDRPDRERRPATGRDRARSPCERPVSPSAIDADRDPHHPAAPAVGPQAREEIAARGDRRIEQVDDGRRLLEVRAHQAIASAQRADVADRESAGPAARGPGATVRTSAGPSRPAASGSCQSTSAPGRTIRIAIPSAAASRSAISSCRDLPQVYGPRIRGSRRAWRALVLTLRRRARRSDHRKAAHEDEAPDASGVHRLQEMTGGVDRVALMLGVACRRFPAAACTTTSAPATACGASAVDSDRRRPIPARADRQASRRGRCRARGRAPATISAPRNPRAPVTTTRRWSDAGATAAPGAPVDSRRAAASVRATSCFERGRSREEDARVETGEGPPVSTARWNSPIISASPG